MSSELVVVAVLPCTPGKEERLQSLLSAMTKSVKDNEPGCTRYHCHKSTADGNTEFVMVETYKDQAAFDGHTQTDHFKGLFKTMTDEGCLSGEVKIVPCKSVAGFESR